MANSDSYKFLNIILLESNFKRKEEIEASDLPQSINIDIGNQLEGSKLFVVLTLDFLAGTEEDPIIASNIKMVGIFETSNGENVLNPEYFGQVNAPAIIFPFIREHLASVSIKAGITPILLPPINFIKLAEDKKALEK